MIWLSRGEKAAARNLDKAGRIMLALPDCNPPPRLEGETPPQTGPRCGGRIKIWAQFRLLLFAAFVELSCYQALFECGCGSRLTR
jgi:hypothetical protein